MQHKHLLLLALMEIKMKTQVAIQVFSNNKVQVNVNNGTKLIESKVIDNGEENIFELEKSDTITLNEVE